MKFPLVLTCEHAGNAIPAEWRHHFSGMRRLLAGHHGYDIGALALARFFARRFNCDLYFTEYSRLLVDCNRSAHNPAIFSRATGALPPGKKEELLERYYLPYRAGVEREVERLVSQRGSALHVSIHSFTPELGGKTRNADAAFLYDPSREGEKRLCVLWRDALRERASGLKVRFNYPYRGTSDGFTTHLRRSYGQREYLGIELEVNQRHLAGKGSSRKRMADAVADSLAAAMEKYYTA